ncbi:MAG TPA: DUF1761 domain-containing protein [Bryobacteraceae bacterium]|jgi:hypothetical protein
MRELHLHIHPILGATVARMAIGALWYSPVLFLKTWMRLTGIGEQQMKQGMGGKIAGDIAGSFVMAFAMAHMVAWAEATEVFGGLLVGFLCWIGFVAVSSLNTVTYEKRPFKLFALHNGYNLVSLLAMGVILATWS